MDDIKVKGFDVDKMLTKLKINVMNMFAYTIIQRDRNYKIHLQEIVRRGCGQVVFEQDNGLDCVTEKHD